MSRCDHHLLPPLAAQRGLPPIVGDILARRDFETSLVPLKSSLHVLLPLARGNAILHSPRLRHPGNPTFLIQTRRMSCDMEKASFVSHQQQQILGNDRARGPRLPLEVLDTILMCDVYVSTLGQTQWYYLHPRRAVGPTTLWSKLKRSGNRPAKYRRNGRIAKEDFHALCILCDTAAARSPVVPAMVPETSMLATRRGTCGSERARISISRCMWPLLLHMCVLEIPNSATSTFCFFLRARTVLALCFAGECRRLVQCSTPGECRRLVSSELQSEME